MSNLSSFVKLYPNWISDIDCFSTIESLESADWHEHTFYDANTRTSTKLSGSNELDVSYFRPHTYGYLSSRCQDAVNSYIKELDYYWFNTWSGCSEIRFNRYIKDTKMAEHCDHIRTIFDGQSKGVPILSCLGILNDNYSGGEFYLNDEKITLYGGDVLIFPSNFMFPHKVDTVTEGTRYSFISWFW